MKMKRSKFAAVVAGANAGDAPFGAEVADGLDADAHRLIDILLGQAVDDNFHHRFDFRRQFGLSHAFQGRAEGVVGRSTERLVFGADFRTGAHDSAGERHDHVRHLAHRFNRRFAGGQSFGL